jgi:hypothetical protein
MSETPLLFPFFDVAMRAIAILIPCALPLVLMPEPAPRNHPKRRATQSG